MSIKDVALRAAVLKALTDRIREEYDAARVDIHQELIALAEATGAATVKVKLDDVEIATVSLTGGKAAVRVEDERKFLAWVQANHPTEIEPRVRESFRKQLLDNGGADANGEIADGLDVAHKGVPYVSTRFTPGGRAAVAAAWQEGRLAEISGQRQAVDA